jgi:putative tryptophan/tyrosine transport system substrate-binding protein
MRRRELITLFGSVAAAWPRAACAQQSERVRSVGVLIGTADDAEGQARAVLLRQGLSELGWSEGRNIRIDYRWAGGDAARAKADAAQLVSRKPDVIIATGTISLAAIQNETSTIPIVFVGVADPVGQGFVPSLAHPGGNITGFTDLDFSIGGKWLELIREIAPDLGRIAFIFNPEAAPFADKLGELMKPVARSLGINLMVSPTRDAAELDRALVAVSGEPKGGLIIDPDGFIAANRGLIISLAARYNLPAIYPFRVYAVAGGLLSYGYDYWEPWRWLPSYVDKILKGASPADLPIQRPTKFELIINLKTAKELGLTVPPQLLDRATELIE